VLFELLTGRTPFDGAPVEVVAKVMADPIPWPLEARPDMPRELARVIMRALQRDPSQRFQTMRDLAAALAPFGPSQTAAAAVADAQRGRGRLGEILVRDGLLTQANLERALAEQRHSGKMLGQVLLDMGFVAQSDLLTALAKQQGIVVPAANEPIERERKQREATTDSRGLSPVPRLPRRRHRTTWIAIAVGLPTGVLVAMGLALLLRGGRPSHDARGLVAPTAAVAAPNVALTPTSEPQMAAPPARTVVDEPGGVSAPPAAPGGAGAKPARGAAPARATRKAFNPTTL
jgi:hypothetical protein